MAWVSLAGLPYSNAPAMKSYLHYYLQIGYAKEDEERKKSGHIRQQQCSQNKYLKVFTSCFGMGISPVLYTVGQ
jgi:hypothetical protein